MKSTGNRNTSNNKLSRPKNTDERRAKCNKHFCFFGEIHSFVLCFAAKPITRSRRIEEGAIDKSELSVAITFNSIELPLVQLNS